MRKKESEQDTQILQLAGMVLIGVLTAFGICLICLILFSAGVSNGLLPEEWINSLTLTACLIGSGAGGWLAARHQSSCHLLTGLAVGGGLFLMLLTVGYLTCETVSIANGGAFLLGGCLCGGGAAGLLCGGRGKKRTSKEKKRKRR